MKFSIFSILLLTLFVFVSQISTVKANQPKMSEVVLRRRAEQTTATQGGAAGHQGSTGTGSNNATTATTTAAPTTKAKGPPVIWASPDILQNGTLFYIAISISTLLWYTGKAVDMSLDQQERRAEYLASR